MKPSGPRSIDPVTIVHVDAERGFSGGEVQVFLLLEGLRARGWRPVLACPPGSASERRARELELDVRPIAMRNDADAPAVIALARLFADLRASLVHLHTGRATWLGGVAARIAGVPALTTRRMDRDVARGVRTRLVHRELTRATVAISPAVARLLERGGVPSDRVRVIWSAVDPRRLVPARSRAAVRAALGAGADEVVLLALGALERRKGFDVLIDALAELASRSIAPTAWIAGAGADADELARLASARGVAERVRWLGRRDDVADLLQACDALVMPSRREGLGVAALEAMAVGKAVIATRVGGLGEAVIDRRTGLLVEPDDAPDLARAIELVACDASLRERLGRGGRERVAETFLPEHMVDAYERLYRELLER